MANGTDPGRQPRHDGQNTLPLAHAALQCNRKLQTFVASVRLRIVGLELELDGRIIAYPSIGGGSAGKAAAVCFENRKASRIRETRRLGSRKGSQATNKNDREERLPRNIGPLGRKRVQESLENRGQKSGREQPRLLLHELERGHVCVDGGS